MKPLEIIDRGLALLPMKMTSTDSIRLLLAIGHQESDWIHTRQIKGPARGYFQFEPNGVLGVRGHRSTKALYHDVLVKRGLDPELESGSVCEALAEDHPLAASLARLLLWTHPRPIPHTPHKAWEYYEWLWRPGKPRPEKWTDSWKFALEAMG